MPSRPDHPGPRPARPADAPTVEPGRRRALPASPTSPPAGPVPRRALPASPTSPPAGPVPRRALPASPTSPPAGPVPRRTLPASPTSPPGGPVPRRAAPFGLRRPSASEVLLLWAPTALGVTVALVIIAAVAVTRGSGAGPAPRASIDYAWTPPVADYTPAVATTTRAPSPPPPPNTLPPLSPSARPTTAKPRTTPPPPPAPPPVTGRYSLVDTYRDGFIGQVLVTNPAANQREWTVRLEFPRGVGRLQTFWVDGAPPPEFDRLGGAYVFTGRTPVTARGKLALRVQFERWGRDIAPTACTVNGTACASA
ncbi:hypothetical protein RB614_29085 [Phytohabitans sp. ZYX-F-186]|uniref:CBM2 domain-containing protein n=1 Tax=Phytohabitans maris TaxID=3071409 RepID=A0ABU0ZNI1_9ACTN|nr:hypothetical protein [Phytohabitans sp. ZYX-F-186]MDQ7908593.1 hypothetical protein [Phytohabitans sp. ZYX-F-186]